MVSLFSKNSRRRVKHNLGGGTAPLGRRPCVLEGAEKASFGAGRGGVLNTLYTNIPFDAELST